MSECVLGTCWPHGKDVRVRQVRVWDVATLQCLATLTGHSGAVRALAASPDRVFSGSDDTTIKACPACDTTSCDPSAFICSDASDGKCHVNWMASRQLLGSCLLACINVVLHLVGLISVCVCACAFACACAQCVHVRTCLCALACC